MGHRHKGRGVGSGKEGEKKNEFVLISSGS